MHFLGHRPVVLPQTETQLFQQQSARQIMTEDFSDDSRKLRLYYSNATNRIRAREENRARFQNVTKKIQQEITEMTLPA